MAVSPPLSGLYGQRATVPNTIHLRDYYVAPAASGGSDSNPGTQAQPFATIAHAASIVNGLGSATGTWVHVAAGSYTEAQIYLTANGSSNFPIVFVSDVLWTAKVTTTDTTTAFFASSAGTNSASGLGYVYIIGFDITGTGCACGIQMGTPNMWVEQNFVHDIGTALSTSTSGGGIDGQNYGDGVNPMGHTIRRNVVANCGPAGTLQLQGIYLTSYGAVCQDNLIASCPSASIASNHNATHLTITNNTILNAGYGAIEIASSALTIQGCTVANNLIAYGTNYDIYEQALAPSGAVGANTFANNLFFGNTTHPGYTLLGSDTGTVTGTISGLDPLFINYQSDGSGDYRVKYGSPAIGAALAVDAPAIDLLGVTWPTTRGYDIGAFVYQVPVETQLQYRVQLRDHSLQPLGELTDFIDGDLVPIFNDVGSWVFTVRAKNNPMAQYFAAGNGIIVSRDRGDGSGAQTILSGPIWHLERHLKDDTYILSGPTDEWWLKARRADPVTTYPYSSSIVGDAPLLYYRMGDASGPTVTDSSGHGTNATAHSGNTFNQPGGIDDSNTALAFDGTVNAWVGVPNPAIASGSFYIHGWIFNAGPGTLGTTNYGCLCGYDSTHRLLVGTSGATTGQLLTQFGGNFQAVGTVTLNAWHHILYQYDSSANLEYWYIDGKLDSSHTPSAAPVWNSAFDIGTYGANVAGTNYAWNGRIDEFVMGTGILSASRISAIYALGLSRYANAAYDTRTGTASTVMRTYVNVNAASGAITSRQVTGMSLAADPAIGSSVTGNARFDNLLTLLQQLAISGGDLGFRVIQTNNGVLTFSIYQPATRSNAIFSRDLGNLLDAVYTLDGPQANQDVAAGGGQGTARVFATDSDSTSINTWGRVEGFVDTRDTSDIPTMHQRNTADLAQNKQKTNLTITPQDTPALQFGRDYFLGDIVNVQIDGATITDKIRQVHIQLNGNEQELVTPGIGNAGSGQIAWLYDAKKRALDAVAAQLRRLQAAQ